MHIVQFAHPGGEFRVPADNSTRLPNGEYNVGWNRGPHRRRLIKHEGRYVDANGVLQCGELLFWTEWEGPTTATRIRPTNGLCNARYLHKVKYPEYSEGEGNVVNACCQNTDPCVFGKSFKYSNCRQDHNLVLRNLLKGSLIAFVSLIRGTYYLDTLLVVNEYQAYSTDQKEAINCSKEYRALTLDRLGAHRNYTFYRGANFSGNDCSKNALFSFTPSRIYSGLDNQQDFARCALDVDAINKAVGKSVFTGVNLRGIKQTLATAQETCSVWKEIVRQVTTQGFVCGVNFNWPSR